MKPLPFVLAVLAIAAASCKKDLPNENSASVSCTVSVAKGILKYGSATLRCGSKGKLYDFSSDTVFTATMEYSSFPVLDSLTLDIVRDSTKAPADSVAGSLGYQCLIKGRVTKSNGTTYITQSIDDSIDSVKTYKQLTKKIADDYFTKNKSINLIKLAL